MSPAVGFYDDSGSCHGNAGATPLVLLPHVANMPTLRYDGTIGLGTMLLDNLGKFEHQTAAIAAVGAHEFGHILQFKYVNREIQEIVDSEDSVVRAELFADFVCGYYAGIRKLRQEEWPAVIQGLNQFHGGDHKFNRGHHGTPCERVGSVLDGFRVGSQGELPGKALADLALQYVKDLKLQLVYSENVCEQVDLDKASECFPKSGD